MSRLVNNIAASISTRTQHALKILFPLKLLEGFKLTQRRAFGPRGLALRDVPGKMYNLKLSNSPSSESLVDLPVKHIIIGTFHLLENSDVYVTILL